MSSSGSIITPPPVIVRSPSSGFAPLLELVNSTNDDLKLSFAKLLISSVQTPVCYTEDEMLGELEDVTKRHRLHSISHDMAKRVLDVKYVGAKSCGATDYSMYRCSSSRDGVLYMSQDTCYGKGMVAKRADQLFLTALSDLVLAKARDLDLPQHPYENNDSCDPFAGKGGPYKPTVVVHADGAGMLTKVTSYTDRLVYDMSGVTTIKDYDGEITSFADGEAWLEELEFVADKKGYFKLGNGVAARGGGDPSTFKGGFPARDDESLSKLWELLGVSDEAFCERYRKEVTRTTQLESTYNRVARQNAERLHACVLESSEDEKEEESIDTVLEKIWRQELPDYLFDLE
jgi:hypothetical protein